MIKVFISQPMKDKSDEDILNERKTSIDVVKSLYNDEVEIIDSYFADYNPNNGCIPLKYLSKSLELLADADVAYFAKEWERARGCKIEHDAAVAYGISTIYGI